MAVILTNTGVQFPSGTTQTDPFVSSSVTRDKIGYSGNCIQVAYSTNPVAEDIGHPSYANDLNNLRATSCSVSITTTKANSKIIVSGTVDIGFSQTGQHMYVDIWRSTGGGSFVSLTGAYRANASSDAFGGFHPDIGTTGWYDRHQAFTVIDTPNVASGTSLTYKIYVGNWAGSSTRVGYHNDNGRYFAPMIAMEISA